METVQNNGKANKNNASSKTKQKKLLALSEKLKQNIARRKSYQNKLPQKDFPVK